MKIVKYGRLRAIDVDPPRPEDLARSLARARMVIDILHEMLAKDEIDPELFSRKFFEWSLIKYRLETVLKNAARKCVVNGNGGEDCED
ncbi:hypothetical protein J7J18_02590 [bacterium]|nr:hypothetical protein [bacterium]